MMRNTYDITRAGSSDRLILQLDVLRSCRQIYQVGKQMMSGVVILNIIRSTTSSFYALAIIDAV